MKRYKAGFSVNGKRYETIVVAGDTQKAREMVLLQYPGAKNLNITDLPN